MRTSESGMTLVELLVSLFVFSFIAVIGSSTIHSTVQVRDSVDERLQTLRELEVTRSLIRADLSQVASHVVLPNRHGQVFVSGAASGDTRTLLQFVRARSAADGLTGPGYGYAFIEYRLEEGDLLRIESDVSSVLGGSEPMTRVLLSGVEDIDVKYLSAGIWRDVWSGIQGDTAKAPLPQAVEMNVSLKDFGSLPQLFRVEG